MEKATDDEVKKVNLKWLDRVKDLAEPVGVQNLTLVELMRSRHRGDVIKIASKIYCRYRAMGVAPLKIHTDRECSFLSRLFQSWCQRMGLYQTMTGGDEGPSNGRSKRVALGSSTGQASRVGLVKNAFFCSVAVGWSPYEAVVANWGPGHSQDEAVASIRPGSSCSTFSHYDLDGPFTFDDSSWEYSPNRWNDGPTLRIRGRECQRSALQAQLPPLLHPERAAEPRQRRRQRYLDSNRGDVSDPDLWDFMRGATVGAASSTDEEAVESEDPSDDFSLVTDQPESPEDEEGDV